MLYHVSILNQSRQLEPYPLDTLSAAMRTAATPCLEKVIVLGNLTAWLSPTGFLRANKIEVLWCGA